jgi:protease PrsW
MEFVQSVVLGFVPGAFWLWYLYRKDDHEPEPLSLVILVFVLGGFSTAAVLSVRPFFEDMLPLGTGLDHALSDAFLLTAPLEETMKFAALLIGIGWSRELDEPLDGIIYGTAVGLGFASVENVVYLLQETGIGARGQLAVLRGFTSTLVHVSASGAIGFFLGLTRFSPPAKRPWLVIVGFLVAIGFHGAYDVFLSGSIGWIALMLVLPGMLFVLSMKIHWARAQSEDYHAAKDE